MSFFYEFVIKIIPQCEVGFFLKSEEKPVASQRHVAELAPEAWPYALCLNALPAVVDDAEAVAVVGFAEPAAVKKIKLVEAHYVKPHLVFPSVKHVVVHAEADELPLHALVGREQVVS